MAEEKPCFSPVPVTLIAGFLGAGKTTLLNRILLGEHGKRVAVLVNDFGDVSIDQELVAARDDTSVTLANGCICCTIRDDLIGAVQGLLRRTPAPEHLVVELSGIADPGSVIRTFALMEQRWPLFLDGVLGLVDAAEFPEEADPHHVLAREQLVLADVVLLNKVDLVPEPRVRELRERIRTWVPTARVVETVEADVPLPLLLGLDAERALDRRAEAREPPEHAHGFSTHTFRTREPLSLEKLRRACTELEPGVFRAKGFVHLDARPGHRTVLQIVGRRARIDLGEPWGERVPETVLVFIGSSGGFDAAELDRTFLACRADRASSGNVLTSAIDWMRSRFRGGRDGASS
ncbi:MAG: GTP-binding protein [Polyangiaceae bacterium]